MTYETLTAADREAMLETIGVSNIEELFRDIPAGVRFDRPLELGDPLTEQEILAGATVTTTRRSAARFPTHLT